LGDIISLDIATGTPLRLHGPTTGRAYLTADEAISAAGHKRHLLEVILKNKNGKIVANWWETSGKGGLLGHTEQKAFGRINLDAAQGFDLELRGQYSACTRKGGCFNTIDHVSRKYGIDITYRASNKPWNAFFEANNGFIPNFFENDVLTSNTGVNSNTRGTPSPSSPKNADGGAGGKRSNMSGSMRRRSGKAKASNRTAPSPPVIHSSRTSGRGRITKRLPDFSKSQGGVTKRSRATAGVIDNKARSTGPKMPESKITIADSVYTRKALGGAIDEDLIKQRGQRFRASAFRFLRGMALGLLIDYMIASIINDFERKIEVIEQPRIKEAWEREVYRRVYPQIEEFIKFEPDVSPRGKLKVDGKTYYPGDKWYIDVRWETLFRAQADGFFSVDSVVFAYKFMAGDPDYVYLFEGIKYISHEPTPYGFKPTKGKRREDPHDQWVRRYPDARKILVWDREIHLLAIK